MSRRRLSFDSLDRPADLLWLGLGATIGGGHFFLIAQMVLLAHSSLPLIVYICGTFLVALPVIYAEILWGRWFQRSLFLGFRSYRPLWAYLGLIGSAAIVCQIPNLLKKTSGVLLMVAKLATQGGQVPSGLVRSFDTDVAALGVVMLGAWNAALVLLAFPIRWRVHVFKWALIFISFVWCGLLYYNVSFFGFGDLGQLFALDSSGVTPAILLKSLSLSLVGTTAGLGIFQNFALYSTAPSVAGTFADRAYWKKPGRLLSLPLKILLVHGALVGFSFLLVMPFAPSLVTSYSAQTGLRPVLFEWLPQVWGQLRGGGVMNVLWFFSLALLGWIGLIALLDFVVHQMESALAWTRRQTLLHFSVGGVGLVLMTLVPGINAQLEDVSRVFLWPAFTLYFVLWVDRHMPLKTQQRFLGRSLFLDQAALLLFSLLKALLPVILLAELLQSLFEKLA